MRLFPGLCVVIVVGCGSPKEDVPTGHAATSAGARASVADPLGFCERARRLLIGRRKCFEEDTSLKMALDQIAKVTADAPSDQVARRRVAAGCAVDLDGLMRVEQPHDCPLDVLDSERTELQAFLAGWYGERTPAPTTGNAVTDAALGKLASDRDAACACTDMTCARAAQTTAETDAKAVPSEPPAGEAARQMIDEVGRCRQKLAFAPAR